MSPDGNNEERVVYCKYCGKLCVKLVSSRPIVFPLELVLKEKNEQIEQLELENEQLLKELIVEKLNTRCLTKVLKDIIGVIVLFLLLHWLYNGSNETSVFELSDV
ncbi:hypothetical protein LIER_12272 [Lithospermum erythrorhizon]|uniref:Uncharacterized protein n=1 Tax=Lithospermum erythrorhizon TaxID=34254 RepID=A0AAV3PU56_LITER